MLRSLVHYWRVNLAVLFGAAVASAVLTGALLVGDSVKGSLRELTLDRLGRIDSALVTSTFFGEGLAGRLEPDVQAAVPALILRGAAVHADSGRRASKIAILGIGDGFPALWDSELDLSRRQGQFGPSVAVNATLAQEVGASVGDALLLNFGQATVIPRDTLMGETDPEDVVGALRVTLVNILPDQGLGRFSLLPNQQTPRNAFVDLRQLQRTLDQRGKANALLLAHQAQTDAAGLLARALRFEDIGLSVTRDGEHLNLESAEFVLRPNVDEAVVAIVEQLGAPYLRVQSYLANKIRHDGRAIPYSLVAALDPRQGADWSALSDASGRPLGPLADDEIVLGRWAAEDLRVGPGETIELDYFVVGAREQLSTETHAFRVAALAGRGGLALDRELTPDYPGMQDAEDMSAWDPPFPVDLDLIRPKDEDYWDEFGPTPKGFVSLATGRKLWSTRYGSTTSIRIGAAPGQQLEQTEQSLTQQLLAQLPPSSFGVELRPVKAQGLTAAEGPTDFAGLFIAFSVFLIVSAAMLVGLLFSLNVEQRVKQVGLLLAVGYPLASVRRRFLGEGTLLAAVGAALGLLGGVGYAALLMLGLRTVWRPAIGLSALELHVLPLSLLLGWAIALLVIVFAIVLTIRRLRRVPLPVLLAGSTSTPRPAGASRWTRIVAWVCLVLALLLVGYGVAAGVLDSPGLSMGSGALLLVAGLAFFSLWCRQTRRRGVSPLLGAALAGMAARNSSWSPGRSVLSVALVACACFVIVLVGANRQEFGDELEARNSATGGFSLIATSDVPIYQDMNRREGRLELGFDDAETEALGDARVLPLRFLPGDDASCLNLYQPEKPHIIGVPPEMVERDAFSFVKSVELPDGMASPWQLLQRALEPGVIPAIGDSHSLQWILKKKIGDEITLQDEYGQTLRLRFVAALARSVFQSEILISEQQFLEHFPSQTGYSMFLADTARGRETEVSGLLERRLGDYGFDATTTRERMAAFQVVDNTYLSTFQTLGGLGLLLGTVGLGVILVRNVMERRGELATLRAFGFRRSRLGWMVAAENGFLLVVGALIGSLAALAAVAPRLGALRVPWGSLAVTLGVVLLVGMLSSAVAVAMALRIPLLPALKADH